MGLTLSRRTKIVCTIGPASSTADRMRGLLKAGMDVARLNFSHGTQEEHRQQYTQLRSVAAELGANLAIAQDLQGPKIRTGKMKDGAVVDLVKGAELVITTREVLGDAGCVSTTYAHLPQDVSPGDRILIADGLIELRVRKVDAEDVTCEVVRGGPLGQHKGINLPGVKVAAPSLTEKDREDLAFGLALGVDYVALSFVRSPEDVRELRNLMRETGAKTGIIAKIERPEALEHFEGIVVLSDAVMVARGDLGVEVPFEEVPEVQKRLIRTCNTYGVPVITATQMLESMVNHMRPTRAEVTDVANAILDGTDAVMLSGETAAGQYPIEACEVMAKVAARADGALAARPSADLWQRLQGRDVRNASTLASSGGAVQHAYADAIGMAVCAMAETLNVRQIVCFTRSGYTARAIARYRPATCITAITSFEETQRKCALLWGVKTLRSAEIDGVDEMVVQVERMMLEQKLAARGDTIILVAGTPLAVAGRTNLLKLHTIGG